MKACPFTDELYIDELNTGDARVAEHLAGCATCREEQARQQRLRALLTALPQVEAPAAVAQRLRTGVLPSASLSCGETLDLLEAYRDNALTPAQTFLVEDHLLWCDDCALALAQAERVSALLAALPEEPAPAVIAERIAVARQPWWQRLLPQAPAWGIGLAAAMLVITLLTNLTRPLPMVAKHPTSAPTLPVVIPVTPTAPMSNLTEPTPAPADRHPAPTHEPAISAVIIPTLPTPAPRAMRPGVLVYAQPPRMVAHNEYGTDTTRVDPDVKPVETASADYTASARDGMVRIASEDELASKEESLSSAPEVMVASASHHRADVAPAAPAPSSDMDPVARATAMREALNEDLRRRKVPTTPKPIVIRSDDREKTAGVLVTIK